MRYRAFIMASVVYAEINENIVEESIKLRKKYRLKTPDSIIAATAMVNKLTLITNNEKDFKPVYNLDILNPWKL